MKAKKINYFISENYIPDWSVQDALRELYQNFIDYGVYTVAKREYNDELDNVIFSNSFEPENANLLIIGDSNKTEESRGKYGEGLKMAALVLLRNNGSLLVNTTNFSARFELITNDDTTIRTLGVEISEPLPNLKVGNFDVSITVPKEIYDDYQSKLIVSTDVLHIREGYGAIVNKPKGNLYVGGLYVCKLKGLEYAYDILPIHINLDRDRKVPKEYEVKWVIGKIQETYAKFDVTGKSDDMQYATIPEAYYPKYVPRGRGNKVVFTTQVQNEKGEVEQVEVSDRFNEQLTKVPWFTKLVNRIVSFIKTNQKTDDLCLNFRTKYCYSSDARAEFDLIMEKLGVDYIDKLKDIDELPF